MIFPVAAAFVFVMIRVINVVVSVMTRVGVRAVTVVTLCEALLSAATAQVAGDAAESLYHEQCEDTQHGEGSCDGGLAEHGD